MLARPGPVPGGDGWALEVKFDGMRAQLRWDGRVLCIRSRPGRNCSAEFPELEAMADALGPRRAILDGELVCFGADGQPDFERLRGRLRSHRRAAALASARAPATFLAFDPLHLAGRSTLDLAYAARRELLEQLELEGPAWRMPRHFVGRSEAVLAATQERGLEGVVAKRLDSPYKPGARNGAWVKHKHRRTEPLLITPGPPLRRAGRLLARQAAGGRQPRARRQRLAWALGRGEGAAARSARGRRAAPSPAPPAGAAGGAGGGDGRLPRAGAGAGQGCRAA